MELGESGWYYKMEIEDMYSSFCFWAVVVHAEGFPALWPLNMVSIIVKKNHISVTKKNKQAKLTM